MSPGPIPSSAIKKFCEDEDLDPLESEALHWIIRHVDNHERARAAARLQDERTKNKVRR